MDELALVAQLRDDYPAGIDLTEPQRRLAAEITANAAEPGRPAAQRGVSGPDTRRATDLRPARGRGFRHRTARRVAVGTAAVGAAAALALVALVPRGAPVARPGHGQADARAGRPAHGFLLTMAVKAAAAGGQSAGRWYCHQMEQGGRVLVGPDDTTLQAPWDQGRPASLAGYRYAIFTKYMIQSCFEPPRKGAPDGTVDGATQQLGAQPASPADVAAWRRAGSPASWIAWYDKTVRITMAPGRRYFAGPRNLTGTPFNYATLPTSPAQLKAYFLAHHPEFHNTGTQNEVLYDDAISVMIAQSPPAVRAAAYRLLASLPGIRMKPNVQDPAGRSGTAVWLSQAGPTLGLTIIDTATSTLLCTEGVAQHPVAHVAVGTVIDYTLFVSSGWTNTPPSS